MFFIPTNMCFLLSKNLQNKRFATFLDFCSFFIFFGQYPQKTCYGDQNHHQHAIYLNFLNFLMIYLPKNNNENFSLSRWFLAPILPGLLCWYGYWNNAKRIFIWYQNIFLINQNKFIFDTIYLYDIKIYLHSIKINLYSKRNIFII